MGLLRRPLLLPDSLFIVRFPVHHNESPFHTSLGTLSRKTLSPASSSPVRPMLIGARDAQCQSGLLSHGPRAHVRLYQGLRSSKVGGGSPESFVFMGFSSPLISSLPCHLISSHPIAPATRGAAPFPPQPLDSHTLLSLERGARQRNKANAGGTEPRSSGAKSGSKSTPFVDAIDVAVQVRVGLEDECM